MNFSFSGKEKESMINSFYMLSDEDKKDVVENIDKYSIDDIEAKLHNMLEREVTSERIGEMVMERLKDLDDIAYVRFASVYRQFKDINSFMSELAKIIKKA